MKKFFLPALILIIGTAAFVCFLLFTMGGLRPSWYSPTNVPFSSVRAYIYDSDLKDIKGILMLGDAVYKNRKFDVWVDVEKTKIEVKYQPGLEGTVLNFKPTFVEWSTGPSTIVDVNQITIITSYQEDVMKWGELIQDIKKLINSRRQQEIQPIRVKP